MRQSLSFPPVAEGSVGGAVQAGASAAGAVQVDASAGGAASEECGTAGAAPGSAGGPAGVMDRPIDLAGVLAAGHHPSAGAVVLFSGEVRASNNGREVAFLEYEAHLPLAEKMIAGILAEARARWSLTVAIARHRVGRVEIGETAVVVITASAHRSEAYTANRYIIDRIKHEAPIWKCEHYRDGTKEWGNNCNCVAVTGDVSKHIYESER